MLNGGVFFTTMSISPNDLQRTVTERLAMALQENDFMKTALRNMTEQLEAAEEIIMRLQAKDIDWKSPNEELAHHLNHQ